MAENEAEILEKLKTMVMQYDGEGAANWAKIAVEKGIEPIKAVDAMTEAIRRVGDGFAKGEFWLPDLVGAAAAMQRGARLLEEAIARTGVKRQTLGVVVLGTVFGDIHSIGKDMVSTLLKAEGFTVHDLGINVTAQRFIEIIEKEQADILAMSALLTTTAPEQRKVIEAMAERGIRDKVKVVVGGAAITQEFADSIGADGYSPTAIGGVKVSKRLIGK